MNQPSVSIGPKTANMTLQKAAISIYDGRYAIQTNYMFNINRIRSLN